MIGRRNNVYLNQPQHSGFPYPNHPFHWLMGGYDFTRQPQFPYAFTQPYWQPAAGNWQNPYLAQPFGGNMNMQMNPQWSQQLMAPEANSHYSKTLFENPLQAQDDPIYGYYSHQQDFQNPNPYPQQAFLPKHPTGLQSIMNSFKSQDGNLDLNKMVDTAGQMVNAVTQVSSLVKGLGGMFKA